MPCASALPAHSAPFPSFPSRTRPSPARDKNADRTHSLGQMQTPEQGQMQLQATPNAFWTEGTVVVEAMGPGSHSSHVHGLLRGPLIDDIEAEPCIDPQTPRARTSYNEQQPASTHTSLLLSGKTFTSDGIRILTPTHLPNLLRVSSPRRAAGRFSAPLAVGCPPVHHMPA